MKAIHCPIVFYEKEFRFNFFWGCLTYKRKDANRDGPTNDLTIDYHDKKQSIDAVNEPFKMKRRDSGDGLQKVRHEWIARRYAQLLTWLSIHCYPLTNACLYFQLNIFRNAGDASKFYYSIYPSMKQQQTLCLPRALFIATTSRRFKQHGTLFIGAFLPTVRMHAWVVEDGMPADSFDNQWIYYRPVLMLI